MDVIEIHKKLLEPIYYKFRVQSCKFGKATIISYIDARQLQDRLDEVVGFQNWQVDYREIKGNLFAGIGLKLDNEWVWKYDCGTESSVEKEKGEASDSFKRAGVMWGVGRFLYSLPLIILKTKDHTNKANKTTTYPATDKDEILWNADELNAYCRSLSNKKSVENVRGEVKMAKPQSPTQVLMSNNKELWDKTIAWLLEKNSSNRLLKIKDSYIITDADYKLLEDALIDAEFTKERDNKIN
ncbi:Rad52/Rad22 family DNA repair protein [Sphingobacterium faecium]|uniref:Rad52/Rad22 family DNA repair protein n=1 Tax=Sphingobacterium faecium TaxID=34087 RepID=UPI002478CEC4|nr:Rad52/Rad22 family DNA repair protein [Sphingobacterium faecium]WGQ15616.1 Rad52/Rad22 family DNA repair protein [Sphingobacterium faecium]